MCAQTQIRKNTWIGVDGQIIHKTLYVYNMIFLHICDTIFLISPIHTYGHLYLIYMYIIYDTLYVYDVIFLYIRDTFSYFTYSYFVHTGTYVQSTCISQRKLNLHIL